MEKYQHLVSVIIPVYKVEDYLNACVNSILSQTYQKLEIILVDDGSPDKCPSMCDEYAALDNRIKVIHKENGGLSDARNAGIAIATGKYLFCVDSDDVIEENTIEYLMNLAIQHDAQIVSTTKRSKENRHDIVVGTGEEVYLQIVERFAWEAWGKLVERELVADLSYPVGKLYEDLGYVPYAILRAKKAVLADNGMYHYTIRTDSIMGREKQDIYISEDLVCLLEKLIQYTKESKPNVYNFTLTWFIGFLYHKYRLAVTNDSTKEKNSAFVKAYRQFLRCHRRQLLFKKGLGKKKRLRLLYISYQ